MGKNVGRKRKRRNKVIIFELTIKIENKNKKARTPFVSKNIKSFNYFRKQFDFL